MTATTTTTNDSLNLLPHIQECFPSVTSYEIIDTITQANAEGYLVKTKPTNDELFVKLVNASKYSHKSWPDLRRTLLYARTEVRFYNETLPKMETKGLKGIAPRCYRATYDLNDIISENDRAVDVSNVDPSVDNMDKKGGVLILAAIDTTNNYFQDSPLTPSQALRSLEALAKIHAAAWQDEDILSDAADRLSRGSYHLKLRNPKELANIVESWEGFARNFEGCDPDLFARESVRRLGERIFAVAGEISAELSPGPRDAYATLCHGDYKSMNLFLPKSSSDDNNAIMIDFASTGVGIGMSDVAMHVYHALRPTDINEESLITAYLDKLSQERRRYNQNPDDYPRHVAMRHFRLAAIDYFRFFLGRFWKSATLESMEKKRGSKNTSLINRDVDAAMAFVAKVDQFLEEYEREKIDNK